MHTTHTKTAVSGKPFRRNGRALMLAVIASTMLAASVIAQPAQAASAEVRQYQIPAGSVEQALSNFSKSAGVIVVFTPELVAGRQSPGLNGEADITTALSELLQGTGLQAVKSDTGSYVLKPVPNAGVGVLKAVKVAATAVADGTTEGTGSFTTESTSAATGLNLSLRETPQSVTVLTRERLDVAGISSLGDALAQAPGIVYTPAGSPVGGYASLDSRGYSVNSLVLDGVPFPVSAIAGYAAIQGFGTLNTDVYDSVTVVRGATGLMTGAGDPSAAVVLTRKRPTEELQAFVSQSLGTWQRSRTLGDVGGPLNSEGTVRGRIVGVYDTGEAWKDSYSYDKYTIYGVLEADLTSQTLLTLALDIGDNNADGGAGPYTGYALNDLEGNPTPFGREDNAMTEWSGFDDHRTGVTVALDHSFNDDWKAKLAYNHNKIETNQHFGLASWEPEVDGEATLHIRGYGIENEVDSFGLKIDGNYTLFGREHELATGINGSWADKDTPDWYRNMRNTVNIYTWDRQFPEPDWESLYGFGWHDKEDQTGAYATTRLNFTDDFSLLAGTRVSNWRARALDETGAVTEDRKENNVLTPYLGAVYDITTNLSAYTSYTTIFNPQTSRDVNGDLLEPEEGTNIEVGLKGEWFDSRLNGSVAVFDVKKDNLAILDGDNLTPTGDTAYRAEDHTKGKGWELEVAGELTEGWRLQGGYTRVRTEDSAGERLNGNQPEQQVKLFTTWTPSSLNQLTVGGGVTWQSRTYSPWMNEAWRDNFAQGDYYVANLMGSYEFSDHLKLTVNLNNAFDEVYRTDLDVHDYGAPRNVYATLKYTF